MLPTQGPGAPQARTALPLSPEELPSIGATTGRYLVLLPERPTASAVGALRSAGLQVAVSTDFESRAPAHADLVGSDAFVMESLGVAVVREPPQPRFRTAMAGIGEPGPIVEPERVLVPAAILHGAPGVAAAAPSVPAPNPEYLRGFRDGVVAVTDAALAPRPAETRVATAPSETLVTWGLEAVRASVSSRTGAGIRIAVLDTGLAPAHPDFAGRAVTTASFVPGEDATDGHGHGTHCAGTAFGPLAPVQGPRYGVAYGAELFAGKVLSSAGFGADGYLLAGIDWALRNKCVVISMSLTSTPGPSYSRVFETVAQRALRAGTLLVAAAGNESARPGKIAPVDHPANCPSIMAVGALDRTLAVAPFSNGGTNADGGQIDLAGPGVDVYSSWPPATYRRIDGTSMATPHVAAIAALIAEATGARGSDLWGALVRAAQRLPLAATDVGSGLVQAPP